MAEAQQNSSKMISAQLRNKANEFLNSRKHANNVADILQMFEAETDNYIPLLLTIETIFTELLKRGDLIQVTVPLKPGDESPEALYTKWLSECYEAAITRTLECMKKGHPTSQQQALVTACKLLQAEGQHPLEPATGYYFPSNRLKHIFNALLDAENSTTALIVRFQEFAEYRDVQHYGLKMLCTLAYRKSPTHIFMQNYLELLDKLLTNEMPLDVKLKKKGKDNDKKVDKVLCASKGKPAFVFSAEASRRQASRAWQLAARWPLCADSRTHRRALLLLVSAVLPLLTQPQRATDMLCDSLDAGGAISMLALQGVLQLVQQHRVEYPDMYERLYAMFEPEMFATRYKQRLLHLADVFLSSTHLPEALVAAFAKRLSRLALVAAPADATALLQLLHTLLLRHPALRRMCCDIHADNVMSCDPYVSEETVPTRSRAALSSLWELAALQRQAAPPVAAAAARAACLAPAPRPSPAPDSQLFDAELKRRFKTIELNFIRPHGMSLPSDEKVMHYWELTA